jgi:hypothetical protein
VVLVSDWVQSFDLSFGDIGQGFEQMAEAIEMGGTAANAAAYVGASQPTGSLSVSALNAELTGYEWVPGTANVTSSSSHRPIVGVNFVGSDVETVVHFAPGLCSFGLSVTSTEDPLIVQDHLPVRERITNWPTARSVSPTSHRLHRGLSGHGMPCCKRSTRPS